MKTRITHFFLLLMVTCLSTTMVNAQAYTENFDDITTLTGSGWANQNLSAPVGTTGWVQGDNSVFNAYNGATTAYIFANFNNTGSTGTISNWMFTPNRTLRNGDVFTFYTRKASPDTYPDRLEVRLSTNGASVNAGTTATSVGDFSTLLLSVNPTLVTGVYPTAWTLYTITVSGLSAPTSGRIAFRYFVTGAGSLGTNSDYIGIDNVVYTPYVCPTITVGPASLPAATAGTFYSQQLTQTGALGTPTFSITAGAIASGLTLSPSGLLSGTPAMTGTFNFTVTVSDNSGCSGGQPMTLTVNCPSNGASLSLGDVCSNDGFVNLTGGSPAGGTYSGTGVVGGDFDPAAGTQTITYTVIDMYGCTQTATATQTVNTAPTVTLAAPSPVCSNDGPVTLGGGSPASGTFSGPGVSGGVFVPATGTSTIMYEYTDANGCSNMDMQMITVNTAPTVTLDPIAPACDNQGLIALSGASPAGGTFSGTGVTGSDFDPTNGTQVITYTYTDGNGCSNMDMQTITVNTAPTVMLTPFVPVCDNVGVIALTGESPAGGTFSGTGVTGSDFDPSNGTQTITYAYIDGNGCSNSDAQVITVNIAPTVSLPSFNAVCQDAAPITLAGGAPAGGVYSGTGVTAGVFDPSVGTQTITYLYTDANNCTNSDDEVFVVNTLPTVTLAAITPVCSNSGTVALAGGSPAGGTFSGTGVTGTNFDPSNGTQTVTYTFTDANGCVSSDNEVLTVNTAPTVTLAPFAVLCHNEGIVALSGGSPAGGTYSGTGVSGGNFDPASGTQTIFYGYSDANNCSATASAVQTVDTCIGINEISESAIQCYPNPAYNHVTVSFNAEGTGYFAVRVIDAVGKVITVDEHTNFSGKYQNTFDVNNLTRGLYFIEVRNGNKTGYKRIAVQ